MAVGFNVLSWKTLILNFIGYRLTMGIVKNGVKKEILNNKASNIKLPIVPAKSPGYHIEEK